MVIDNIPGTSPEDKAPRCNLCGGTTYVGSCSGASGLINASVSGNYDSTPGNGCGALDDNSSYQFSLCEWCCDWLMAQFKQPPTVQDYMNGEPEAFFPAAERVRRDDWREMKDQFFTEKVRRDAMRGK